MKDIKNMEIERKFSVKNLSWKKNLEPVLYRQGYLALGEHCLVRVRSEGDKAFIAIKGKRNNFSAAEYQYEIPVAEAESLLKNLSQGALIEKYRYQVNFQGKRWEVDEFLGENKGLYIAEIELKSEDEKFSQPLWIGSELSLDKRFSNIYLSQKAFSSWSEEEQFLFKI